MVPWSTPDLSEITLVLKALLDKAIQNSSLPAGNITTSCDSPETARTAGQCFLTLYMLHVGRDPYWRNTPVSGPRPQLNNAQPLSLSLSYLLTAYCEKDFVLEQRAMSIALQAIHSNPIMTKTLISGRRPIVAIGVELRVPGLDRGGHDRGDESVVASLHSSDPTLGADSGLSRIHCARLADGGSFCATFRRQSRRLPQLHGGDERRCFLRAQASSPLRFLRRPIQARSRASPTRWSQSVAAHSRSPATASIWRLRPRCFSAFRERRPNGM